jgi:hypothetical protein
MIGSVRDQIKVRVKTCSVKVGVLMMTCSINKDTSHSRMKGTTIVKVKTRHLGGQDTEREKNEKAKLRRCTTQILITRACAFTKHYISMIH